MTHPRRRFTPACASAFLFARVLAQTLASAAPVSPAAVAPVVAPLAWLAGQWSCTGEFSASHQPIAPAITAAADRKGWLVGPALG